MPSESPLRDERGKVLYLFAEDASIGKEPVTTGQVHVSVVTRAEQTVVKECVLTETAEIERVPMGIAVDRVPEVRSEGDTLIVPVVEEVLRIERQLILKEEIRIRKMRSSHAHQEVVTVRKQHASITRQPTIQDAAER